ncbi:unnamed protein product [Diplocarpon coronariae]
MAHETQYCSLRYILGTVYSGNTDASEISPQDKIWGEVKSLARFVLGSATGAVAAANGLYVTAAILVATTTSACQPTRFPKIIYKM